MEAGEYDHNDGDDADDDKVGECALTVDTADTVDTDGSMVIDVQIDLVENDILNDEVISESKTCPKDVADKVNSWIDSSVKQTDEYSEEESIFVYDEVNNFNNIY